MANLCDLRHLKSINLLLCVLMSAKIDLLAIKRLNNTLDSLDIYYSFNSKKNLRKRYNISKFTKSLQHARLEPGSLFL